MKYYFALASADPVRIYTNENASIEELRSQYVGSWVRIGEEDHDIDRVIDILTDKEVTQ